MAHQIYQRSVELPVTAEEAFAWHEREGAIDRLIPPWEHVRVSRRDQGIGDGARVELLNWMGPMPLRWVAEHHHYQQGKQFRDRQLSGPFAYWDHTHRFETCESGRGKLVDEIEYEVPGGFLGRLLGGRYIRKKLDRMFQYRHEMTVADLQAHTLAKPQRVAVSGASGLIGSNLVPLLTTGGHEVTRLVRRTPVEGREIRWDPSADAVDASELDGLDSVVHLAGENIAAKRWNARVKERIRDSRVAATHRLCEALARLANPPGTLISASAIGFYEPNKEEVLTEDSPAGTGFLAQVARDWEEATQPAREAGIRVVHLRFGVVLSPQAGALQKMLFPFLIGGGGNVGDGRQWWSWISVDDAAGAIHHALSHPSLTGPVNAVSPNPVTNAEFTKTLGRVLGRPTMIPVPQFAARLALGEMADELLLNSFRVQPTRLLESGYNFRQPELEHALRHLLGR